MKLGLGLYRFRKRGPQLVTAFVTAGGTVIDAAPNYFKGKAHALIGRNSAALKRAATLVVWTKVGFSPSTEALRERIRRELVAEQELVEGHALNPSLIRAEIRDSSAMHPEIRIDGLFLHNPERQLHRLDRHGFWELMKRCIEELERACVDGRLRRWGISVWDGLYGSAVVPAAFSIPEWEEAARSVAGSRHHFEIVQMPLSLARVNVVRDFIRDNSGPLVDCILLKKRIVASSPMNGGALPKVLDDEFTGLFGDGITPGQACLLFLASLRCVSVSLVSPRTTLQLKDILHVRNQEGLSHGSLCRLIELLVKS